MTYVLLRAAVVENSQEQDMPGEMIPLPLPDLWETRWDQGSGF